MLKNLIFHHVGVVTGDLLAATRFYQSLEYASSEIFGDPLQKVRIVLMRREGSPMIELVNPSEESSPAHAWLQRITSGAYHTCYSTPDIERTAEVLRDRSFFPLSEPAPAAAFQGKRVCFLWSAEVGLLELVEE